MFMRSLRYESQLVFNGLRTCPFGKIFSYLKSFISKLKIIQNQRPITLTWIQIYRLVKSSVWLSKKVDCFGIWIWNDQRLWSLDFLVSKGNGKQTDVKSLSYCFELFSVFECCKNAKKTRTVIFILIANYFFCLHLIPCY